MTTILGSTAGATDSAASATRSHSATNSKQPGATARPFAENGNSFFWGGKVKFFDQGKDLMSTFEYNFFSSSKYLTKFFTPSARLNQASLITTM